MKRNYYIVPEALEKGISNIRTRIETSLKTSEYSFSPDLDWADPTMPGVLMTCGLYRFGMPEVCLSLDTSVEEPFTMGIAEYLLNVYVNVVRGQSEVILGDITPFVFGPHSEAELSKFTKQIVAVEVDAKQFYDGFGYVVRDIVTKDSLPRVIQLVASDRSGRFPDERHYSGVTQALIPKI